MDQSVLLCVVQDGSESDTQAIDLSECLIHKMGDLIQVA